MNRRAKNAGLMNLPKSEPALRKIWEALAELDQAVPPSEFFRTVVFGSARLSPTHPSYIATLDMAEALARSGVDIVTGGGPGLMQAANEGAHRAIRGKRGAMSHGICIQNINREEEPNEFLSRVYAHRLILTRLHEFVRAGFWGAFIVAESGGFGTALEQALILQLLQFEQLNVPLIGIGPMWEEWKMWASKHIIDRELAAPKDLERFIVVKNAMDAVPIVLEAFGRFKQRKAA